MNLIKNTVINNNYLTPTEFYLSQNYPNPFNEMTTIKFCVAYKTKIKLEVFNAEGELVKLLVNEEKEPGTYEVEYQSSVGSIRSAKETYYYRLQAGDFIETKKMTLLR